VLVEGGARLLQSFIDAGMRDEIRKIQNSKLKIEKGLQAPQFDNALKVEELNLLNDSIEIYKKKS
jgi:diaminohydroxyphosphoribosylaminopyrimidine deaminase/5-amino-6-(5-phosphoribosylamino)uracil reductase